MFRNSMLDKIRVEIKELLYTRGPVQKSVKTKVTTQGRVRKNVINNDTRMLQRIGASLKRIQS